MKNQLLKLSKLILGIVGFYVFSTFILKEYNSSEFAQPVQKIVEEKQLNPSAFFYSDELFIDTLQQDVTIR